MCGGVIAGEKSSVSFDALPMYSSVTAIQRIVLVYEIVQLLFNGCADLVMV